ncbi:MAG: hypothetical protein AAFU72_16730, partial [Pseudomonadota bacterium]
MAEPRTGALEGAAPPAEGAPGKPAGGDERAKSKKLAPLRGLVPFLAPYRTRIILVSIALVLAAAFTLMVPIAFGRVIDVIDQSAYQLI